MGLAMIREMQRNGYLVDCQLVTASGRFQLRSPEARCIKLRSRKSAPSHSRARIHSHATLRPRERSRGSTPVGAARVVCPID